MTRRLFSRTAAAVAALLVTVTVLAGPAGVHASAPASAAHVNLATTDPRFGIVQTSDQSAIANALGARWTRIGFIWDDIQHNGPQSWNPFALSSHGSDAVVNAELASGRSVVGLLLGTPGWARQNAAWGQASVPANINLPWRDPHNYWAQYCFRLAKHFAGRIDAWTIWNEVSIPATTNGTAGLWTQWRGTPQQYARVLEVADLAIKAANPHAQVVLYGDPFWYDHGAYLAQLYALLAQADPTGRYHGYFDVANLHLYSNPPSFYAIIQQVRALLRQHGWAAKPIWVSETNAEPYDAPRHRAPHTNFRVSEQAQAAFLVDAFATYIAAGVSRVEIYRMADGVETAHGLPAWGLLSNDGTLKPVAQTFRFLVGLLRGARGETFTAGNLYDHQGGVFRVVLHTPGARITVLWNQAGTGTRYALGAHAAQATLYDKYGQASTLRPAHGRYALVLPGGHDFTNPFDHRLPTVGGDPAIIVETAGS